MDFRTRIFFPLYVMMLLLAAFCLANDDSYTCSRATNYRSPDGLGTPTGACGLREYGKTINEAKVSAVSNLYKGGKGCGTCYQVRCKDPKYCCHEGTKVVVTDYGEGPETDFILSPKAYNGLARDKEAAKKLFEQGVVEVEYQRIDCGFPGGIFYSKIDEEHSNPHYFAILLLYHGDKYYITRVKAVYIDEHGKPKSRAMRRAYGAVWDLANPPEDFDLIATLGDDAGVNHHWVQLKSVIRADGEWNASGVAFGTTTDHQLT